MRHWHLMQAVWLPAVCSLPCIALSLTWSQLSIFWGTTYADFLCGYCTFRCIYLWLAPVWPAKAENKHKTRAFGLHPRLWWNHIVHVRNSPHSWNYALYLWLSISQKTYKTMAYYRLHKLIQVMLVTKIKIIGPSEIVWFTGKLVLVKVELFNRWFVFVNICDFIVLCCQRAVVCGNQKIWMLCICMFFKRNTGPQNGHIPHPIVV